MRKNLFAQSLWCFRSKSSAVRRSLLAAGIMAVLTPPLSAAETPVCQAEDAWFPHTQTPRPDDAAFQSISNCVFHQWSWQMFLWLTQEVDGKPRFLSFTSPQSLLGMEQRGLFPRFGKSRTPKSFDEFLQAGTDGIMVDQQGHAIYYSQYVNPTFADFITQNGLTDPVKVRAMDPNTEFPIVDGKGALELKASWKRVAPGEDVSGMFTMNTDVAMLANKGGKIVIDPSRTQPVTLALVGFHIGGIVQGHPEMIWATFEHNKNAPNVPDNPKPDTVVSTQDFTFYRAGTAYASCNVNPASSRLLQLDEANQTLTPVTQVCRRFQFGNDPGLASKNPSIKTNDDNIAALNKSVAGRLTDNDVWKNYFEVGAIWFNVVDGLKPGLDLATDGLLTGSLALSNATIETFTQTQSTMNNCFRCHNTQQEFPPKTNLDPLPGTNLNISHAFQNIYFWSQEKPAESSPADASNNNDGEQK